MQPVNPMPMLSSKIKNRALAFLGGLLLPLGFAPFHWPLLVFVGLALLHRQIHCKSDSAFVTGFAFGMGYFGLGVSWVWNSIHDFGHINGFFSALITLGFVAFLSLYTGLFTLCYRHCGQRYSGLRSALLFACWWTVFEIVRARFFGGFPWLLTGISQIDTPLANLLPVIGVYGVGMLVAFCSALLSWIFLTSGLARMKAQLVIVGVLAGPLWLSSWDWATVEEPPLSVAIIQANLSMRDKWDETLFWDILDSYQQKINQSLDKKLIVLPESAIPLPAQYIEDYLETLKTQASNAGAALIVGIPEKKDHNGDLAYFNSLRVLGQGSGRYYKRHLVPFGEYIPRPFALLSQWGPLQNAGMQPGDYSQKLANAHNRPFASLICYELAYGNLLRQQLPAAQWIVSISDDGWFGNSLAPYQQQQMAQVLSLQSARYQIMANNDGLSSVINSKGRIIAALPAFRSGILNAGIQPVQGLTPWVQWGDWPVLWFLLIILLHAFVDQCRSGLRKKQSDQLYSRLTFESQEK